MGSERRFPETFDVVGCPMNSQNDPTCGEVRLTLHLVPSCRTCGITETMTALTRLNRNNASDVRHRNVSHAVKLQKQTSVTRSASTQPLKITNVPQHAPVTVRCYTVHRRTADIHLNCWPCLYRQRSRQALERGRDARVAPCPGH